MVVPVIARDRNFLALPHLAHEQYARDDGHAQDDERKLDLAQVQRSASARNASTRRRYSSGCTWIAPT